MKRIPWGGTLRGVSAAVALFTAAACAPRQTIVPPLTPTPSNTRQVGQFVWYDLLTTDVEGAKRFYGGLFGWTFQDGGEDSPVFTTIAHNGRPIGGIFAIREMKREVNASQWISSLSVGDVDQAVETVKRLGGSVEAEPQELPRRGRVAVVRDNQGALLALVASPTGDPPLDRTEVGGLVWTELWTRDGDASLSFYEALIGYDHSAFDHQAGGDYYLLEKGGARQAGVLVYALDGVQPNWLPYVLVEDPAPLVQKVEGLGGRVIFAPSPEARGGSVAVISDPSGAAITIQKWPMEGLDR